MVGVVEMVVALKGNMDWFGANLADWTLGGVLSEKSRGGRGTATGRILTPRLIVIASTRQIRGTVVLVVWGDFTYISRKVKQGCQATGCMVESALREEDIVQWV